MTLTELISEARKKSRVHEMDQSDLEVAQYINRGIRRFSEFASNREGEAIVLLTPRFTVSTIQAVKVETNTLGPANVPLVSTDLDRATGAEFASELQSQLRTVLSDGTITVTWDTEAWTLTLTFPGATAISVTAPTGGYADGLEFFNGVIATTGSSYETAGSIKYRVEGDMPSDFSRSISARWDDTQLREMDYDSMGMLYTSEYSGDPEYYGIRDFSLRVVPYPSEPTAVNVLYIKRFAEFDLSGDPLDGTQVCSIPEGYQSAPAFFAAGMMAENRFEYETAMFMERRFKELTTEYTINMSNENTDIGFSKPSRGSKLWSGEVVI